MSGFEFAQGNALVMTTTSTPGTTVANGTLLIFTGTPTGTGDVVLPSPAAQGWCAVAWPKSGTSGTLGISGTIQQADGSSVSSVQIPPTGTTFFASVDTSTWHQVVGGNVSNLTVHALTSTGPTALATDGISNTTIGDTLTVGGAVTIGDTLTVGGAVTIGDTLTVGGAVTINGTDIYPGGPSLHLHGYADFATELSYTTNTFGWNAPLLSQNAGWGPLDGNPLSGSLVGANSIASLYSGIAGPTIYHDMEMWADVIIMHVSGLTVNGPMNGLNVSTDSGGTVLSSTSSGSSGGIVMANGAGNSIGMGLGLIINNISAGDIIINQMNKSNVLNLMIFSNPVVTVDWGGAGAGGPRLGFFGGATQAQQQTSGVTDTPGSWTFGKLIHALQNYGLIGS